MESICGYEILPRDTGQRRWPKEVKGQLVAQTYRKREFLRTFCH